MTRGYKNNNPLNIRHNGDKFQGEIQPSQDKAFKQFENIAYGYRAGFVTLHTYLKRGWDTIAIIVSKWAPPSENYTEKYIEAVERWSGIDRYKKLTERSGEDYINIVAAMSRMENGISANMAEVKKGFSLQNRIK